MSCISYRLEALHRSHRHHVRFDRCEVYLAALRQPLCRPRCAPRLKPLISSHVGLRRHRSVSAAARCLTRRPTNADPLRYSLDCNKPDRPGPRPQTTASRLSIPTQHCLVSRRAYLASIPHRWPVPIQFRIRKQRAERIAADTEL